MLTDYQIQVLNDARSILKLVKPERTFEGGVVCEACLRGEAAIFQAMNVLHNYGKVPMSDGQLHNRSDGQVTV